VLFEGDAFVIQDHLFGKQFDGNADGIIALVTRVAQEECADNACSISPVLDDCVHDAVTQFSGSRITAFVPLLALRHVRCCIRAGRCDCGRC
jgi:hypothetical protein